MGLTSNEFHDVEDRSAIVKVFQFISVQAPNGAKDATKQRLVRSHAVKQALQSKRRREQQSGDNFRAVNTNVVNTNVSRQRSVKKKLRVVSLGSSLVALSAGMLDPFRTLPVNSSRLQSLLCDCNAMKAPEPVFSLVEELAFQNFHSVFRTGLVDPALLNAVMLSCSFALAGGSVDVECLGYRGEAIRHVREKMNCLEEAASESTIGSILLLAGVQARLGMKSELQVHMEAVQMLLKICDRQGFRLTVGIKRAVFWQDLNSSILAKSRRIVDHNTFAELCWSRSALSSDFVKLPQGFQKQCIRDAAHVRKGDDMYMAHINNHIASIQSRLAELSDQAPFSQCCS